MADIRPLKPEEYEAAHKMAEAKTPWGSKMKGVFFGKFDKDALKAVVSVRMTVTIEGAIGESLKDVRDTRLWVDGQLQGAGINEYFSFTPRKEMLDWIQREFGESVEGFDGKLIVRRR